MIVDTSAVIAIARLESMASACLRALETAPALAMSSATYVELSVVSLRSGNLDVQNAIAEIMSLYPIEIVAFTHGHAEIARVAYGRFGQGQQHPAKLNFGDCFAYALARERNETLLFVGSDFIHTDIIPALAPAE